MTEFRIPKKLIEVALPLDDINFASAREKSIRHGHPSALHLWWARRPLATARAVLFAQMVNDPGYERQLGRGMNKEKAALERERLFEIMRDLVLWENTNNQEVLRKAREEIQKSWKETCALNRNHPQANDLFNPERIPAFHDPFAGGGAIPLEAQRLGLESYASDLNPVAVLINKSMIEIPPRFSGRKPVGPIPVEEKQILISEDWSGSKGLAEDVRRYGLWMRQEAEKRIGQMYPKVIISEDVVKSQPELASLIGEELTVIAWLWARTVKSPNPAFSHVNVPLVSSFVLSSKIGKEAWVEPVIEGDSYRFSVKTKGNIAIEETVNRSGAICLLSNSAIDFKYIRSEAKLGRMGSKLMAVVCEGPRGRIFISPNEDIEKAAIVDVPNDIPESDLPNKALGFRVQEYGMLKWKHLFSSRQLTLLNTFSELASEARLKVKNDCISQGSPCDDLGFEEGGGEAKAYGEAISIYLSFIVSQLANHGSMVCGWNSANTQMRGVFSRQAISMVWDYAESNPFCDSSGSFNNLFERMVKGFQALGISGEGHAVQVDAMVQNISRNKIISTDPPYYDNIGYADLSDFFYVWLRKSVRTIFPSLFSTILVPKAEELVATPFRHESKEKAESFFLSGMKHVMHNLMEQSHPAFPVSIYYAFKQSETKGDSTASTGWETFLEAVIQSGFTIKGTWPMHTEKPGRSRDNDSNALASSIVLICQKRNEDAPSISRREYIRKLNEVLPDALYDMTQGGVSSPVAPVDLSQAIIGPGMAIFSQYKAVLEADGKSMSVNSALALINRFLAEDDFDSDTQFCIHWFESFGWSDGQYGQAETMSKAKGIGINGLVESGVIIAGGGYVRLYKWIEYPEDWNPLKDTRISVWEALHQLIRVLNTQGEQQTAGLLSLMAAKSDSIRALAYRLYTLCERKGWADDARYYNEIMTAWESVDKQSKEIAVAIDSTAQIEFDL